MLKTTFVDMLNFRSRKFMLLFLSLLFSASCCKYNCIVNSIEVPESLLILTEKKDVKYCDILKKAVEGDTNSIRQLFLLRIGDSAGYDHGNILVLVISNLGEDILIESLKNITELQKKEVKSYLIAGLEYGNSKYSGEMLSNVFPKVDTFLDSK